MARVHFGDSGEIGGCDITGLNLNELSQPRLFTLGVDTCLMKSDVDLRAPMRGETPLLTSILDFLLRREFMSELSFLLRLDRMSDPLEKEAGGIV